MNKIYENIFIGTFIYSLGVLSGLKKKKDSKLPWVSLNLFQQTPADRYIGDLFGSLGGRNFLIEFKAGERMDKKEVEKQERLISALDEVSKLISLRSHFFSGGSVLKSGEASLNFSHYILNEDSRISFNIREFAEGVFSGIINHKDEKYPLGCDGDEICNYISCLRKLYEGEKSSSTGGLIANISEDGKISYISTPNIFELTLTLDQLNTNMEEAKEYSKPTHRPSHAMSGPGGR